MKGKYEYEAPRTYTVAFLSNTDLIPLRFDLCGYSDMSQKYRIFTKVTRNKITFTKRKHYIKLGTESSVVCEIYSYHSGADEELRF